MVNTFTERLLELSHAKSNSIAVHLLMDQKPDNAVTYGDLIHGASWYSDSLLKAGIHPGEVVIIILQHGEELIYAFFGAILHGAIPSIMPFLTEKLSPEQYRRSLASLFEITAPAAVITYPEFLDEVHKAIPPASSIRSVLVTDQIIQQGGLTPSVFTGSQSAPESTVLLQHSSGTTGLQKGVALSHQAVFNQLESYSSALKLYPSDVIVSWLPLYHDMGLIAGFIMPILMGVPLVLLSPFDWVRAPHKLMQAVMKYHGTLSWLPNFAFNFCTQKIRERDLDGIDLSTWRAISNCSEPMYWKSHQMFLDRFKSYGLRSSALTTCYAMAENVFAVSQGGIDAPVTIDRISQRGLLVDRCATPGAPGEDNINMLSAGRPIEKTLIKVLNPHYGELPDRQIGEIAIQSNCMLTGYYNRSDLSKKAFHNGWYLTGDLGYLADGEVYVTGRKKDLIIVGGKNIYPQDLENLASEVHGVHPGRVVAFGVPNETSGTEDVVVIAEVDHKDNDIDDADFESLPEYNRITDEIRARVTRGSDIALRYVRLVRSGWLLKTSSGKVARNANRERYLHELTAG